MMARLTNKSFPIFFWLTVREPLRQVVVLLSYFNLDLEWNDFVQMSETNTQKNITVSGFLSIWNINAVLNYTSVIGYFFRLALSPSVANPLLPDFLLI